MTEKPYPCCGVEPELLDLKDGFCYHCEDCGRIAPIDDWNSMPHGWMRVGEYEPPTMTPVFVANHYYEPFIAWKYENKWEIGIVDAMRGIDAPEYWMPIPPLPKEDE